MTATASMVLPPIAPIISINGLSTQFGQDIVHENLNLNVYAGEILSLIGSSGAGKTTLLRHMVGLTSPTAGKVHVLGMSLTQLSPLAYCQLARRWGILFQTGALFSVLSVFDNVALPLRELHSIPEDLIQDVVKCRLHMVGLSLADGDKRPADLSGGMMKRVALARALALDPELLFLDEPTAGLDPERSDEFVALIRELHRQLHFTIVMITHDLDTLLALSSRVAVLADKQVIVCDTVSEVLKIDHPFIHAFFLGERGRRALAPKVP